MLLRSSSTPILTSCLHHSKDSSPEPELHSLQRTNSISFRSVSSIDDISSSKRVINSKPPHRCGIHHCKNISIDEDHEEEKEGAEPRSRIHRLLSSSGLDDEGDKEGFVLRTLVEGGGAGGGRGGGGRRSDGEAGNDGSEFYRSTDAYYEKMISQDPGNSLLLGNYAKFLKEVRGDYGKAEEYYERAILANPNDGNILSFYADLIWEKDKDSQRAENYFDQAVKSAPDDSYVLASYARFLWDAEEDEDEETEFGFGSQHESESAATFLSGHPPLAATS
ncbi:Tetratricopeptide repeat (TPR)-like superfamily protein [Euphorbia peplus]|nr:Tetratricopeptide repeat (TPR)-like superfamily protein [Euphorbia peplus]